MGAGIRCEYVQKILPGLELERKTVARKPSRFDWPSSQNWDPKRPDPAVTLVRGRSSWVSLRILPKSPLEKAWRNTFHYSPQTHITTPTILHDTTCHLHWLMQIKYLRREMFASAHPDS